MGTLLLFAAVIRFVFSRIALLNGYGEAMGCLISETPR
jgi:hypothetical protein